MAKAAISEDTALAGKVKLPVAMLLVVVMLGVCLGMAAVGGGVYFLMKSGKLPIGAAAGRDAANAPGGAGEGKVHQVVLEPILVNLADAGGHAYLRLGLTLDVEDTPGAATEKTKDVPAKSSDESAVPAGAAVAVGATAPPSEIETSIRDTVLTVLGQQTSAWLLGPDGKEHLKLELQDAIAKREPRVKVKDLFISDFLVQI